MSNNPISTCDLLYSDPGGMNDYGPNQTYTQVITSSIPNDRLEVNFLDFSLADGDTLWIYNGDNTNAPLIGISNSITGYAAKPFCTDDNPLGITYPSGTTGNTNDYLPSPGCLYFTPGPAWYFMRINDPGDLLIYISQTSIATGAGLDVDFACWGPFYANNQNDFMQRWCCGEYNLYDANTPSHRPADGNHTNDMGVYPVSNLVDCSYYSHSTEWAFIPNAQTGQFYILLITNYSEQPGEIFFNSVPKYSTATTDCSLLGSLSTSSHLCEGDPIVLNSNNNQPGITHTWNGPNGFTSTYPNLVIPNATPANSGTYYLTLTNQSGNSFVDSTYISVHAMPSVTLSSTALSICIGDSVTLTASGANNYSWNHDLGPESQHTTIPSDSITYIVIGNSYGCIDTAQISIAVNPLPQVEIQEPIAEICPNYSAIPINSIPSGGTPGYNYSWSGVGIVNQNNNTTLFNPEITYCDEEFSIVLEITDQNLCKGQDSIIIGISDTINPQFTTLPFPLLYATGTFPNYAMPDLTDIVRNNSSDNCWNINQLIISQSIEVGTTLNENCYVQVTVTDPCGNSCSTSIQIIIPLHIQITDVDHVSCFGANDGSAAVSSYGGIPPYQYQWSNSAPPGSTVISSLQAGTYQVTVTDSLGVALNDNITITQPDSLIVNYTKADTHCEQNNGMFEVTPSGGTPPYQYNWSQGGNNAEISDLVEGVYSCIVTDAHGCTTNLQDTIHKINPLHVVEIIGNRETCNQQNGSIQITLAEGTPPYEYLWNSANGSSGSELTQLVGDYYFVTITDQYGCTDTTSIEISSVNFSVSVAEITPSYCDRNNGTVTLALTGDVENPFIDWGPILHHNDLYAHRLSGGIYTVYIADYGCIDSITFEIEDIPRPIACFDYDPTGELEINQMVYFYNCSSHGEFYEWDFGDGYTYTEYNAQHAYYGGGKYEVTLYTSNQYGCIDSTSVFIIVRGGVTVHIPNAFTPDQDGFNDVFLPLFSLINETGYQLTIFNRWGQIVFHTTNPTDGWDGTYRNKEALAGTYGYVLIFQDEAGKKFKRVGSLHLIR